MPKAGSNSLASRTLLIFLTRLFPAVATTAVMVLYSRKLPLAENGAYSTFWINLNLLLPFLTIGLHNLVLTYPPGSFRHLLLRHKKRLLLAALWLLAVALSFAGLMSGAMPGSFTIAAVFAIAYALAIIQESVLIAEGAYKWLVGINLLYAIVWMYLHVYWLNHQKPVMEVFVPLAIVTIARLLAGMVAQRVTNLNPISPPDTLPPDKALYQLWLHLALFDCIQVASTWLDKFVVAQLFSKAETAIYYNGSINIPFIPVLLSAAGAAVLTSLKGNNTGDELARLARRSGKLLSSVVFPVFAFLLLFGHEVILVVFKAKYAASIPIFLTSLLVLPLKAYSFTTPLQKLHKGRIINIGAAAELALALSLMYPLYLVLGLPGIALSFVVSTWCQAAYYQHHTARLLGLPQKLLLPHTNWMVKMAVCIAIFLLLRYCTLFISEKKVVLFLGIAVMCVLSGALLAFELKQPTTHGHNQQQN